jgi:hypothetical protein
MTAIKKAALERAKARYPNSPRKAHYEFIRLWEADCKKEVARLLAQPSEGNMLNIFHSCK